MSTVVRDAYASLAINFASRALVDPAGLATALTDRDGRVVLASDATPLANVEAVVRTCAEYFGSLDPADVVITNDPYSGGTRVQDQFVVSPVHDTGGALSGYAVACAPFVDVGGMALGNDVPEAGDLFTEGVRIRPIRVRRGGVADEDIIACLKLNSRVPALIAADVTVMSDVVLALARDAAGILADGTAERLVADARDVLAEALAGEGTATARRTLAAGDDLVIELRLALENGRLVADFTGSSEQPGAGHFSATAASTTTAVVRALREFSGCALNSALTEIVRVNAPEGSVVNPAYPAPVGGSLEHTCPEVLAMTTECLNAVTRSHA